MTSRARSEQHIEMESIQKIREIVEGKAESFSSAEYLSLMNHLLKLSKHFSSGGIEAYLSQRPARPRHLITDLYLKSLNETREPAIRNKEQNDAFTEDVMAEFVSKSERFAMYVYLFSRVSYLLQNTAVVPYLKRDIEAELTRAPAHRAEIMRVWLVWLSEQF